MLSIFDLSIGLIWFILYRWKITEKISIRTTYFGLAHTIELFGFGLFYIFFSTKSFLFCTGLYTPGFEIDFSTEFLMGHSSGAHITTNYMKLGCHNIKGMILISPVDGVDPFGLIEDFCITPGEKLAFTTPTLIITGKSFLEALILASVNLQYYQRLFIEFQEKYKFTTCCEQILF